MRDHRRLRVWEDAHRLALALCADTRGFPVDQRFGLTAQIRRAAASIPTDIAAGSGAASRADSARFLDIAAASASQVEHQLLLARDLGYIEEVIHRVRLRDVVAVRGRAARPRQTVLGEQG
jgi:four helix bundle protein